jgi:hypothetical protein
MCLFKISRGGGCEKAFKTWQDDDNDDENEVIIIDDDDELVNGFWEGVCVIAPVEG